MEKIKMQSENLVDENVEKIGKLFPNCITEGKDENGQTTKFVDFDMLKQELSKVVVDGNDERYMLNWAGKKQSILTANSPINATLRPCEEESMGKDGKVGGFDSENLYIEGDNLDVLKLLRETYLNKIKMIYIDPPYNTGNDFVYNDDFATSADEYLQNSKSYDEEGNRMVQNLNSNGRFHSDWLSMMYPRLKLARDLLTDDGVIFISIDDNEQANLKKICDEIYGTNCFCGTLIQSKGNAQNDAHNMQKNHEYILSYFKNSNSNLENIISPKEIIEKEVFNDEKGYFYKGSGLVTGGEGGTLNRRPNLGHSIYYNEDTKDIIAVQDYDVVKAKTSNNEEEVYKTDYDLINKGYVVIRPPKKGTKLGVWTWSLEKINAEKNDLLISKTKDGYSIYKKVYTTEKVYQKNSKNYVMIKKDMPTRSVLDFSTAKGSAVVNDLLGMKVFDNPKNIDLIMYLISSINNKNMTVLDFFSGSATTAHAVMEQNLLDGGNRHFVMVQLPEICNDINKKQGFKTICEIGKERIRRAGKKIIEEKILKIQNEQIKQVDKNTFTLDGKIQLPDIGFRVLKLDSSNMKDVYYNPADISQDLLSQLESNIKEDRSSLDLLFQVMLDMGVMLSQKIEKRSIQGKTVYIVGEYDEENQPNLICCFDDNISEDVVTEIAKLKPIYAVFRDSSMSTDSMSVNFDQIFATHSPNTTRKVL